MTSSPHLKLEQNFKAQGLQPVAGLDEVGRGSWAGPVFAGAVILPLDRSNLRKALRGVRDSKQCSPSQRSRLYEVIRSIALSYAIGSASPDEIDALGIAPATCLAMRRAIENLSLLPSALIVDYVNLKEIRLPQEHPPRAEQISLSVAAASIIAKVERDRWMSAQDEVYPGYGWSSHKGYGTSQHQQMLHELGPCPLHRMTFAPIRASLILDAAQ